ncbi:hypothetical protein A3K86_12625 [Photobacterium jeanii]|uniref:DNA-binding response regulator n=1 Tax=Photobacterium jeanii TaxID=858640 RepID=A0A178K9N9_9GAMM|nr:response regulator transcription factor [Photobacterium jeanii]OAN14051.1 hypothetical protein A3K86_12625 [Photobacterium jeanii]PST86936.1 DNA-binding response regulator [Photobacterium jeanii]
MASRICRQSMTVLIVEPNEEDSQQLSEHYWQEGFIVKRQRDARALNHAATFTDIDLIVLSMELPEMGAFKLLKQCRQITDTPIIVLAASYHVPDCTSSFLYGADDYMTLQRPLQELVYRSQAILRRIHNVGIGAEKRTELVIGELTMDRQTLRVTVNEQAISMTPIQFKLLWTLASQHSEVLTKAYLYRQVLAREFSPYDRSLDMHLSRVRKKLVAAGMSATRLQTSHGKGYCFA